MTNRDTTTPPSPAPTLKPCPFCGKTEPVRRCDNNENDDNAGNDLNYAVVCDFNLDGCGAASGYHESPHQAEEKWNRRAQSAQSADEGGGRDAGSKPNARYDNGWYYCWLIERRDMPQPMWWTVGCTWSAYAGEALWYARWSDANADAGECPHDVVVCEHGFDLREFDHGGAR